jgi:hypothetical protein
LDRSAKTTTQNGDNAMKAIPILAIAIASALQGTAVFAQDPSGMQGMDKHKHREMMPIHQKMQEEQKLKMPKSTNFSRK